MWSKYSCVDQSTEEKWSRQTTEQHQSMQGNTRGELSKEGWSREPYRPQRQQTTFSHRLRFILLSSDLASLLQTLCRLHKGHGPAPAVQRCKHSGSCRQRAQQLLHGQRSTGAVPAPHSVSPRGTDRAALGSAMLVARGQLWRTPRARRPSRPQGQHHDPGNNTNVQTRPSSRSFPVNSAPAALADSENSRGGYVEPAAYFRACKTARKRSNSASS